MRVVLVGMQDLLAILKHLQGPLQGLGQSGTNEYKNEEVPQRGGNPTRTKKEELHSVVKEWS